MRVKFARLDVIVVYQHCGGVHYDTRLELFRRVAESIRPNRMTVVLGDLNCCPLRNNTNDRLLGTFLSLAGLHRQEHAQMTFKDVSQLDHVLVPNRFGSAIRRSTVLVPPLHTDHFLLQATLKFTFSTKKSRRNGNAAQQLGWDNLADNPRLREDFSRVFELNWRKTTAFPTLWGDPNDPTGIEAYIKAVKDTAADVLPRPPEQMRAPVAWRDPTLRDAAGAAKEAVARKLSAEHQRKALETYSNLLEHRPWLAWKSARSMIRREAPRQSSVLTTDDFTAHFRQLLCPPVQSADEAVATLRELDSILDRVRKAHTDPFKHGTPKWRTGAFTEQEMVDVAKSFANHRATGPDGFRTEVLKCDKCREVLLGIINDMQRSGSVPQVLKASTLVPLHKKDDVDDTCNYRGICLLSVITKVLNKLILYRVRDALDKLLLPCQNAYRPDRSCQQHILAVSELIARHKNSAEQLVLLFVDFSKAFDSVVRPLLRRLLEWWKCPDELVNLIFAVLDDQELRVRVNGQEGDPFTPTAGVLQGDTLAPYLFLLPMDLIFRFIDVDDTLGVRLYGNVMPAELRQMLKDKASLGLPPLQRLPALGYADDVMLAAHRLVDAQTMLHRLEHVGGLFGLRINTGKGKTEAMVLNRSPPPLPTTARRRCEGTVRTRAAAAASDDQDVVCIRSAAGDIIRETQEYKYLGCIIGGGWQRDFENRVHKTWGLIHTHNAIWRADDSVRSEKYRLFKALVASSLTYSAIAWPATTTVLNRINGVYARMLRHCLNVHVDFDNLDKHPPLEELMGESLYASSAVLWQNSRALGHWIRSDQKHGREVAAVAVIRAATIRSVLIPGKLGRSITPVQALQRLILDLEREDPPTAMLKLAEERKPWRLACRSAVAREQGRVVEVVCQRRRKEAAAGKRTWDELDDSALQRRVIGVTARAAARR